jgi:serine/threonine protein kinase
MLLRNEDSKEDDQKYLIEVAVKKIDLNNGKRKMLDTFRRDVRAMALINHPNVIRIYGVGLYENIIF